MDDELNIPPLPDDVEFGNAPVNYGDDLQQKLLHNALSHFCDEVITDHTEQDASKGVTTREVVWRFGNGRFRARLVTYNQEASIGTFELWDGKDWSRLTSPRAFAEKLTEASQK